jgi:hypothetical protein
VVDAVYGERVFGELGGFPVETVLEAEGDELTTVKVEVDSTPSCRAFEF